MLGLDKPEPAKIALKPALSPSLMLNKIWDVDALACFKLILKLVL